LEIQLLDLEVVYINRRSRISHRLRHNRVFVRLTAAATVYLGARIGLCIAATSRKGSHLRRGHSVIWWQVVGVS
jgi:hypothetical protein